MVSSCTPVGSWSLTDRKDMGFIESWKTTMGGYRQLGNCFEGIC